MCDRVKIFLDSIRNGQHFGNRSTGKILAPQVLLRKFINTGELGPVTAIGTDYVTSELAGIVRVNREPNSNRANMELVQEDTVGKVLDVIRTGLIEDGAPWAHRICVKAPNSSPLSSNVRESGMFLNP